MTPSRPIRLAYVIDAIDTPAAGTERQLLALLHGLDPAAFAVHLVCLRGSPWLSSQRLPVPVTVCGVHSFRDPRIVGDVARLAALCRRERFDIVQTFFKDGNLFGTVGAWLGGTRNVVSSRRNIGHWHSPQQLAALRFLRGWTGWYLANSQAVAEHTELVERVERSRIVVIPNGLDVDALDGNREERRRSYRSRWGVPESAYVVGAVANLRAVKNLRELVAAVGLLAGEREDLHAVLIGEGPERRELEGLIGRLGVTGRVHLAGRLEDARPALAALDLGVQCSWAESASNSLMEYMAAGLSVVASEIPGNAELVCHEETALLYPGGDAGALAGALARLMDDRALGRRLGDAAAREARRRFSTRAMLDAHAAFYRRIAEGRLGG